MFYFVVLIISIAAFVTVFGLWIVFWSFAMSDIEQRPVETINQASAVNQP